jgi:hemerythrin
MPVVVWGEQYATGDSAVDCQHRALFKIINELHDVIVSGAEAGAMRRVADALTRYALRHFAAEEQLMESTGYPGLRDHQERHLALRAQAGELFRQHMSGHPMRGSTLSHFLGRQLTTHITTEDRKMVQWVRLQGTSGAQSGHFSLPTSATHVVASAPVVEHGKTRL